MVHHAWSIFCSRSIIDAERQNISLVDVIEEIVLSPELFKNSKEVTIPFRFEFVSCWRRASLDTPASVLGRTRLLDPGGNVLREQEYTIDLKEHPRARTRIALSDLKISRTGAYKFVVEKRDDKLSPWGVETEIIFDISEASS